MSHEEKSRKPVKVVLWYWSSHTTPPSCTETTSPASSCTVTPLDALSSRSEDPCRSPEVTKSCPFLKIPSLVNEPECTT